MASRAETAAAVDWRAEPKIELHLHLEGAAPAALTREVAAKDGAALDGLFDAAGGYAWRDFSEFLLAYDRVAALYASPERAAALAEAVLGACADHGVIYAELIMAPRDVAAPGGPDPIAWSERVAAVSEGAAAVESARGIVSRLVPHCVRGLGPEVCARTAAVIAKAGGARVVGFGMAGDERVGRPGDFGRAFATAREAGLKLTCHAGEFGGPDSVAEALDALGVDRIAHGVRAVEDPTLLRRLAETRTPLDVCPGSNVALGLYPGWAAHPAPALREAGCLITLSTDDPPFFHTDMTREYCEAASNWGWTSADLRSIARESLAAAFCSDADRQMLAPRLDDRT